MANDWEPGMGAKGKGKTGGSGHKSPYAPRVSIDSASWGDVDPELLIRALHGVSERGDALLLGRSRDGGVLVLTVCAGDERIKYYAREAIEMNAHLVDIREACDGLAGRT